jgi:hypothetical protein
VVEDGYEFFAKRQLVTLFSAPNYCGEFDNAGGMMSVDETLMCSFQVSYFFIFFLYKGGFFWIFSLLYSTLFHLPPFRFLCVRGCLDRAQDSCDFGIGSRTLLDLIHFYFVVVDRSRSDMAGG